MREDERSGLDARTPDAARSSGNAQRPRPAETRPPRPKREDLQDETQQTRRFDPRPRTQNRQSVQQPADGAARRESQTMSRQTGTKEAQPAPRRESETAQRGGQPYRRFRPQPRPKTERRAEEAQHPEKRPANVSSKKVDGQSTEGAAKKKKKRMHPLLRFLIKLALTAAILGGVFAFVLGMHIQHGNRMYPFLMDGDLLITYKLDPYHVGDAVAYRSPETGEILVSRIVAAGKSEISVTEVGELLVDGFIPSENVFYPTKPLSDTGITFPYQVSDDGYFVLDDFRTEGRDSRLFGEIKEDALLGKVVYVFRRRGI